MTLREKFPMTDAEGQQSAAGPSAALARKPRRKVLFVIGTLDLGGTESQLVLLAKELKQRGWKVEVFALSQGGVLSETLNRAGIRVLYGLHRPNPLPASPTVAKVGAKSGAAPTRRPSVKAMLVLGAAVTSLVLRIVLTRPRVVHAFLPLTNFLGALAGRVALAPFVITSRRGLGNHQERWPRLKRMDRIANRLSHVVVANSHAVAADMAARDAYDIDRIRVIPNGLDLSRFDDIVHRRDETRRRLGLSQDEVGIIIVANLIPYKGHRDLIQAFALASESRPNLKLFMAGQDRGIGPGLAEEARRLGVGSKVHALGSQSEVPELLAGMDVGVIASHEEGFCNALMEKLAAGLPVVATNVGGNPEAISGMPGCVLVKPRDPADLARGLLAVLDRLPEPTADREFRQRMMRERYSTGAMVDAYERLYLVG
ncbi:glycosyltransferase [bacterium M00.F.Ca.ET.141.01.1.1]|nr:glycosyltransferase [Mesorhizobium sp. M8A.F.Ca.ET.218.01.1.1]TGR27524.1 glycosyltransferase [Mesorhizobium sp. M8A.F.Ca.ET.202.01.1.1]TGR28541.1 glycosyltransferase [Mesorhizobium sp. M8A.F.Ca.ET.197.01.1.1]TGR44370.1 glycosyltransferase [bacterium M00.F.Ca.ET.199.01.1.1]TGR54556.1 glycosyltransferase [Mesorhizobium sp. M8A.F.Ca.ET.198.01.1.1]TGS42797.1 glycosyltransferase [Mesorhizobium sp. M8A.F.Ca.ET.182.01.1.1]TGS79799.1 glycosyltransferase [Mesorhizobium sp. M8A.F.Ca.ET.181.01.1.1]T